MLIYFLRHGLTEYNAEKRYQGQRDIPLSAAGRAMLRKADIEPKTVYITPLCRTRQTAEVLFPTAKLVVLTNACGGINREFAPGTLMLITDFINMMGTNPLIGPNDERFGPRFPDMTEPYSLELRNLAKQTADELGIAYKEGVYMGFMGPCYETAAEIRAFAGMGADAVGMSTVPETMVCNYMGMKVLAVSCITNMATGIAREKHSHQEVLRIANESSQKLCALVECVVREL